jgi:divalent metal cation (Fe/Co/Zn/Cd) transporter
MRQHMARGGSRKVVYAALAGNLAVALTKLVAALWTGSSAMLSESIQSAVDTGNQGLLLNGLHRLSFRVAWREFRAVHADQPLQAAVRRSKNPSVFAVLLEDGAAVIGLLIAACGLALTVWLGDPVFDGIASIAIGGLLVLAAVFLGPRS